jgi:predicted nucleotidyltransferase
MIINLIDKNYAKIISFLAVSPGSRYSRKEIKEKTEMNNIPLDNSLNALSNLKIINESNRLYSLNLENSLIQQFMKERGRISNLPLNIQFMLIEFTGHISKLKSIKKIILFGSYSKLIFSEKSDVDLAIIFPDKIKAELTKNKISRFEDKLSKKYKKNIQSHFFTESDLKHKEDPLIRDILRNGIGLLN